MKKLLKVILVLLLFIPFFVRAEESEDDMVRPYEAKVVSEKGTVIKARNSDKTEIKLNKGDTVYIGYEFDYETGGTYIDDILYDIKLKDIKPVEEKVSSTDSNVYPFDSVVKVIVNDSKGVNLLKGPSYTYDVAYHLDEGTEGTMAYFYEPYIYFEKGDMKGWIDTRVSDVLIGSDSSYIVTKEIKLACGTVPVNTVFTDVYSDYIFYENLLINYNGCKQMVPAYDEGLLVSMFDKYMITGNKAKLYEKPDLDSKVLATVPKNSIIKYMSFYYEKYEDSNGKGISYKLDHEKARVYVEYEGKRGWLDVDDFKEFDTLEAAEKSVKKQKLKNIILASILVLAIAICLLGFVLSGKGK